MNQLFVKSIAILMAGTGLYSCSSFLLPTMHRGTIAGRMETETLKHRISTNWPKKELFSTMHFSPPVHAVRAGAAF